MLSHNVLASEQGYPQLIKVFDGRNDQFAKRRPCNKIFAEIVEPMSVSYSLSNYGEMFKIFGSRPAITKHEDKSCWRRIWINY